MVTIAKGPHSLHHSPKVIAGEEDVFKVEGFIYFLIRNFSQNRFSFAPFYPTMILKQKKPKATEEFAIISYMH